MDERILDALAAADGRLLAIRLDNIGDVVMLGPALRSLSRALPAARIDLMCTPAGAEAASLLPWVDGLLVRRTVWQDASWSMPLDPGRERDLVEDVRARGYGAAFVFTSFSQSPYPPAYVCYLAGVPVRIGQSREFGGSVLSHWVRPPGDEAHQVERNLHLLREVGVPVEGSALEVRIPAEAREEAECLLAEAGLRPGEAFLALAPGASCAARRYDPGRFAAAAALTVERTGLPAVVLASEREVGVAEAVLASGPPAIRSLAGRTSVPVLAAVLELSTAVVCNNSAPLHLAEALGRPMVVLYSGTDLESQWRPRAAPSIVLRRPTWCSPCYGFDCPYELECLDVPPEEVAEAVLRIVSAGAGAAERRRGGVEREREPWIRSAS